MANQGAGMYLLACGNCGHVGPARRLTPGSFAVELLLWLCLLVPGLVYSLWRLSARRDVCAKCGAGQLLPLDTPKGAQIAAQAGVVLTSDAPARPKPAAVGAGRAIGAAVAALLGKGRR